MVRFERTPREEGTEPSVYEHCQSHPDFSGGWQRARQLGPCLCVQAHRELWQRHQDRNKGSGQWLDPGSAPAEELPPEHQHTERAQGASQAWQPGVSPGKVTLTCTRLLVWRNLPGRSVGSWLRPPNSCQPGAPWVRQPHLHPCPHA